MAVNWGLGLQQGPSIADRFNQGLELGRQRQAENALTAYAQNPADPNALNALARHDPRAAITLRQQQAEQQRRAAEQQREQAREAATILGPVYEQMAKMPYEQRRQWLAQVAPRLAARGIPQEAIQGYDPTDQALQADLALSRRVSTERAPAMQQNYEFLRQMNPELAQQYIQRQVESPPVVFDINGDGAPDLVPRSHFTNPGPRGPAAQQGGGPQPGTIEDGYRFRGGDPARQENWEPVNQGGAGSQAPRPFP